MKKFIVSILIIYGLLFLFFSQNSFAQQEIDFSVIPKGEVSGKEVQDIGKNSGNVWNEYNKKAKEYSKDKNGGLGKQLATGIMDWDTLLNYVVYLARFIGELGLLIAAVVIIYIGYQKAVKVFNFQDSPLSNVIKGIIILAGAFAIVKFLYSAFLS